MKAILFTALAICASAVNVDAEDMAIPFRLMTSIHDKEYHAASSQDKIVSQTPELWNAAPCQYWYDDAWYNLIGTNLDTTQSFVATNNLTDTTVYFTMCQLIKNANETICTASGNNDYAAKYNHTGVNGSYCDPLSTSNLNSVDQIDYRLADNSETIGLKYTATDNCSLTVGLICNSSMSSSEYFTSPVLLTNGTTCDYTTTMTAKNNCPVYSLNALWQWLQDYSYLWGAGLIIIGFFLGMFGQKLFSATLFIIGTLVTVVLIWLLFYSTFLSTSTEEWVGWVVLACSIILGLFGGYLLYKCQRLGAAVIGGWGGFLLGVVFNTTVLWAASSEVAFWIISISCALVAAGLAFVFYYHAVILSTGFTGAYFFVRGISLYAGGFPNEWALIEQIKSGAIDHISYWFYLYLFFIIVLAILFIIFQYRHFKKGVEDGDYDANGHPKHPYDAQRQDESKGCCCC